MYLNEVDKKDFVSWKSPKTQQLFPYHLDAI